MPNTDTENVIARIESYFQSQNAAAADVFPGGELRENNGAVTFYSGIPFVILNGVTSSKINPPNLAETIRQVQNYFRAKKVPIIWWVFPSDTPDNLGEELERQGFVKVGEIPGMAVPLEEVSLEMPVLPGVEIVKCENSETRTTYSKVLVEGYGLPEFLAEPFAQLGSLINEKKLGWQGDYMALVDGRPVGVSSVYLISNGVAGIFNVVTLESARRRGIGRALTLQALQDAKKLGGTTGVLGSSEMGYRVYESLGFKEYCKLSQYVWQPE